MSTFLALQKPTFLTVQASTFLKPPFEPIRCIPGNFDGKPLLWRQARPTPPSPPGMDPKPTRADRYKVGSFHF